MLFNIGQQFLSSNKGICTIIETDYEEMYYIIWQASDVKEWIYENDLLKLKFIAKDGAKLLTLQEVCDLCLSFDKYYGTYPEHELEGYEVLKFILDKQAS